MLPDVQQREPDIKIPLTRAGVTNVRKMVRVRREEGKRDVVLLASFECYVDLPRFQKGTHMSRNLEVINEIIDNASKTPVYRIEDLCNDIVKEVLRRHSYASYSEVNMHSRLMLHSMSPSSHLQQSFVTLIARAKAFREEETRVLKEVGAEIEGIILNQSSGKNACTQKARAKLTVETDSANEVKVQDILKVLESSMSAKSYSFLTGEEEAEVLSGASREPKTARDVVGEILEKCKEKFSFLPEESIFTASCRVKEPLLNFEVVDERSAASKELR